jgi:LL-diaminopimelate aminotransferase
MVRINEYYTALNESYLFSEVAKKVAAYKALHPKAEVISLGIGDVTLPLSHAVVKAMHTAVDEMGNGSTFRGYAPEAGYDFLKNTILENDYLARGIKLSSDEIFINDGAKSSLGYFGDILSAECSVAICDPVYPVYVDTNVMGGRAGKLQANGCWSKIAYLSCLPETNFTPCIPKNRADIVYLCSPNNPTGSALNRQQLQAWVNYAIENQSLILFDSAYEAYISDPEIPRSIYEIQGAEEVAVEFRSFSKTAGFTGVRCGYTIVPKKLTCCDANGAAVSLNAMWRRHQSTKFNGTGYIVQRAAEAVYSAEGKAETQQAIRYYMGNAETILEGVRYAGFNAYGGENAPYIWLEIPRGMGSWAFFDKLLNECQVVGTPGVGFGPSGEGYFRLTAFGNCERVNEAIYRIKTWKL